jgi:hypothetical protein
MKHATESELVVHYYGDSTLGAEMEAHLRDCATCARAYEELGRDLAAITPPPVPDPGASYWAELRAGNWKARRAGSPYSDESLGAAMTIWLLPLLYPLAPPALFLGAQLVQTHTEAGVAMLVGALAWAMAGPAAAVVALKRLHGARLDRLVPRLVVYGAVAATVSPALFNLTSRTGMRYAAWYAAVAVIAAAAFVPIRSTSAGSARTRRLHRRSALIIVVFALLHIGNHLVAIVNVPMHSLVLEFARLLYRRPIVEAILFTAITFQIVTGGALASRVLIRRPTPAALVQAMSGLYVAVFFLAHVSAALLARGSTDTNFVWAAGQGGVLARAGSTFLLPYYLLGVSALFVHVGAYLRARLALLIPEVSLQRLSYLAMAFASTVVVTIALALCGIAVLP